jgi:hypothetical protein
MFTSSVLARGKAALQGSETEQRLAVLLYDDAVQILSSFELNQLASLTYHDTTNGLVTSQLDMSDIIIDHLEKIQSQPIQYSVISVQKSLVMTRHILIYGAEQIVPRIRQHLGRHIEALCQYNTILAAQQTSSAWLLRLQGGGVDQAGPIRASAGPLSQLLTNPSQLQFERHTNADPNSLVPIGSRDQAGFVSDAVRLAQLQQRMREQQSVQTRSNLVKADNTFGSGYTAANGKTVVGAAHGIEEMLRQQQKEEQRFSDEASKTAATTASFAEYQAPNLNISLDSTGIHSSSALTETDLLSLDNFDHGATPGPSQPSPTVDLLDFGSTTTTGSSSSVLPGAPLSSNHLLPLHQQPDLLFGTTTMDTLHSTNSAGTALPSSATLGHDRHTDPFQAVSPPPVATTTTTTSPSLSNLLGHLSLGSSTGNSASAIPSVSVSTKSILSATEPADRFSALDALVVGSHRSGGGAAFTTVPVPKPPSSCMTTNTGNSGLSAAAFSSLGNLGGWSMSTTQTSQSQPCATLFSSGQPYSSPDESSSLAFAMAPLSTSASTTSRSTLRVSAAPPMGIDEGDDGGFLMGGAQGAGLQPLGHAPAAPPPPPPPTFY